MSRPLVRAAARVLCVDPDGRALMLANVDPGEPDVVRWVAPGGGVEPGESAHEAACREVREELGLVVDDLGAPVREEVSLFSFDGRAYEGHNTWFAVRTEPFEPSTAGMDAAEVGFTVGWRWMSADDLDSLRPPDLVGPAATATWVREAHAALAPETLRPTVRVLVVDEADRVLLLRSGSRDGTFWFPPGGGLEPGESHVEAARRELREELGLDVGPDGDVGPWVWTRRLVLARGAHLFSGLDLRERWHLLRVGSLVVDRAGWTPEEVATIDDVRWWNLQEIAAGAPGADFAPRDLGELLPPLLAADRSGALSRRAPVEVGL